MQANDCIILRIFSNFKVWVVKKWRTLECEMLLIYNYLATYLNKLFGLFYSNVFKDF